MATGSVVLHVDVLEKGSAQGVGVHQRCAMDAIDFQAMENVLHRGIVVGVTAAVHAGNQFVGPEQYSTL